MLSAVTNKGRFTTLVLTSLCQGTQAVSLAGLPLLLPLIRQDLGLTFAQAGSLASANLLVYALMQIPAGYFADRYSPRKLVVTGTLGMMSLSVLLAFTREYWQLLGIQFFWGFFNALMFTPAMSVFLRWFSSQRRTTAMALPTLGPNLGTVAINLLFPVIANQYHTWRTPFIMAAVIGIAFALALLLSGSDRGSGRTPIKIRMDIFRELFRYSQVWLCFILQFIRFGILRSINFWLPTLLLSEKQFPLQLVGTVIALQAIICASGSIFGGYLSDRFRRPTLIIGASMVMLGITIGLLVIVKSMWLVIVIVFINAIFTQSYFGPLFTLAAEALGPEKTGISNGTSNMFAISGGMVSVYLMGVLRDATGSFEWGLYLICALSAIGLVFTFILEKVRQTKTPPVLNQN